jgi:hypothetical protein
VAQAAPAPRAEAVAARVAPVQQPAVTTTAEVAPAPQAAASEATQIVELGGVAVPPAPGAYVSSVPPSPAHRVAPQSDSYLFPSADYQTSPFTPSAAGSWVIVAALGAVLIVVAKSASARDAERVPEGGGGLSPAPVPRRPFRVRTGITPVVRRPGRGEQPASTGFGVPRTAQPAAAGHWVRSRAELSPSTRHIWRGGELSLAGRRGQHLAQPPP